MEFNKFGTYRRQAIFFSSETAHSSAHNYLFLSKLMYFPINLTSFWTGSGPIPCRLVDFHIL